jgi:hypothetical protein
MSNHLFVKTKNRSFSSSMRRMLTGYVHFNPEADEGLPAFGGAEGDQGLIPSPLGR